MNTHNFQLNKVFHDKAKEYVTRPVMAAKYQPGMENGWMVYYESKLEDGKYFGIRFFSTKDEAQKFIDANEKQYIMENGIPIEMEVKYDLPLPVLCKKDANMKKQDEMDFDFENSTFISDESEGYEFYVLDCDWCDNDTWIIQDMMNGEIRVWNNTMEEPFFGKKSEYVFEKTEKGEYLQVAV